MSIGDGSFDDVIPDKFHRETGRSAKHVNLVSPAKIETVGSPLLVGVSKFKNEIFG